MPNRDVPHPPIRAFRADDMVTIAAPLAGLAPEDITVEVTGKGHVILDARLVDAPGEEYGTIKSDKEVLVDEWDLSPIHRDIALNVAVDGESATMTYRNGVLVVALPVARKTRPAHLRLEAVGGAQGERITRPNP